MNLTDVFSSFMHMSLKVFQYNRREFIKHGFTSAEFMVIKDLAPGEALTLTDMSKRVYKECSNLSGIVDSLVLKGFVGRFHDENDRRIIRISLTDEGRKKRKELFKVLEAYIVRLFEGIDEQDMKVFHRVVGKMDRNAENMRG